MISDPCEVSPCGSHEAHLIEHQQMGGIGFPKGYQGYQRNTPLLFHLFSDLYEKLFSRPKKWTEKKTYDESKQSVPVCYVYVRGACRKKFRLYLGFCPNRLDCWTLLRHIQVPFQVQVGLKMGGFRGKKQPK